MRWISSIELRLSIGARDPGLAVVKTGGHFLRVVTDRGHDAHAGDDYASHSIASTADLAIILIDARTYSSQAGKVKLHQALDVTGIGVRSEMNVPFVEETTPSLTPYYVAWVKS